jgi:hypothetical protein
MKAAYLTVGDSNESLIDQCDGHLEDVEEVSSKMNESKAIWLFNAGTQKTSGSMDCNLSSVYSRVFLGWILTARCWLNACW